MNRLKNIFLGERNLMIISQVLFWLGADIAVFNPFSEIKSILMFSGFLAAAWGFQILLIAKSGKVDFSFQASDTFVLAGLIIFGLGTLFSKHPWNSFWGEGGMLAYSWVSLAILSASYFFLRLSSRSPAIRKLHAYLIFFLSALTAFTSVSLRLFLADWGEHVGGAVISSQFLLLATFLFLFLIGILMPRGVKKIFFLLLAFVALLFMAMFNALPILLIALAGIFLAIVLPRIQKMFKSWPDYLAVLMAAATLLLAILLPVRAWLQQPALLALEIPWFSHLPLLGGSWSDSALFGSGLGNFGEVFLKYKPASFNALPYFNTYFAYARSLPLEIAITGGIFGLLVFFAFAARTLCSLFINVRAEMDIERIGLGVFGVMMAIQAAIYLPTFSLLAIFVWIAALSLAIEQSSVIRHDLSFAARQAIAFGGIVLTISAAYYLIHYKANEFYLFSQNSEVRAASAQRAARALPQEHIHGIIYANEILQKKSELSVEEKKQLHDWYIATLPSLYRFADLAPFIESMSLYLKKTGDSTIPMKESLEKLRKTDPQNPGYILQEAVSSMNALRATINEDTTLTQAQKDELKIIREMLDQALALKPNLQEATEMQLEIESLLVKEE